MGSRPRYVFTQECPHCQGRASIRSSRRVTRLVTDLTVVCNDPECGHSFASQLTVVRTISPSACPDPAVILPIAPPRAPMRRRDPAANDNRPAEASAG